MNKNSIPLQKDTAFWTQRTPLDNSDYLLAFNWNDRDSAWYVSLQDLDGEPIVAGIKLVCNVPLLSKYHYLLTVPPGELMVLSTEPGFDIPGLDDLGTRCELIYLDIDTVTEIKGV